MEIFLISTIICSLIWVSYNPDAPCMEYLPTKLGHLWGTCWDSFSSTIFSHLGNDSYSYWFWFINYRWLITIINRNIQFPPRTWVGCCILAVHYFEWRTVNPTPQTWHVTPWASSSLRECVPFGSWGADIFERTTSWSHLSPWELRFHPVVSGLARPFVLFGYACPWIDFWDGSR